MFKEQMMFFLIIIHVFGVFWKKKKKNYEIQWPRPWDQPTSEGKKLLNALDGGAALSVPPFLWFL